MIGFQHSRFTLLATWPSFPNTWQVSSKAQQVSSADRYFILDTLRPKRRVIPFDAFFSNGEI